MDFFKDNWFVLLMGLIGLAEVITRLTPTQKDNTVLEWIKQILNIVVPNKKREGGTFKSQ